MFIKLILSLIFVVVFFSASNAFAGGGGGGKSAPKAPPPPAPVAPEPIPDTRKTEIKAKSARDAELEQLRRRRGLAGTVLTSPNGSLGSVSSRGVSVLGISNLNG